MSIPAVFIYIYKVSFYEFTLFIYLYQYKCPATRVVGSENSIYTEISRILTNLLRITEFEGPIYFEYLPEFEGEQAARN